MNGITGWVRQLYESWYADQIAEAEEFDRRMIDAEQRLVTLEQRVTHVEKRVGVDRQHSDQLREA